MSSEEYVRVWPDSGDLGGIELTLALPGTPTNASDGPKKSRNKRRFLETVDLKLGEGHENKYFSSLITKYVRHIKFLLSLHVYACLIDLLYCGFSDQLVGWPPVTTARKTVTTTVRRKYVKVAVDGAAYLRKVDLEMYDCYGQLFTALENMFQVIITICK